MKKVLFAICAISSTAHVARADRPNILYIMSDDHCAQAVGAYGGRLAKLNPTPTIDRLAREGMLFENCFVTNSICVPSRASIITGQYSHVNKAYTLRESVAPENQTLAIAMRKAGYHTAMIGKWHLKVEPNFDYYKVLPGQGKYHDPDFRVQGDRPWPRNVVKHEGQHSSDAITDSTLKWLHSGWDRDKPFFLMHHYKAPHDMFENAHRYDGYLEDVDIPEPESLWSQPKFGSIATRGAGDELLPFIGTSIGRRNPRRNYTQLWAKDAKLSDEQATRRAYNTYLKKYLRCVKGVDDNLARLFAYLDQENLFDNTVIIYTGDQGFMLGEHDYMDKRWMYDESQRMPFLIRYPKSIPAGKRTDAIIENVDFAATMLDFAGVETPQQMQGRSFRAICETGREPDGWKQAAYYRYWMHMAHHDNPSHFGIRTKDFKLIFYYGCDMAGRNRTPPGWELYDLKKDPREVVNQYDNPKYADTTAKLKEELRALRQRIGDTEADFPAIKAIVDEFWDYDEADRKKAIEISHSYLAQKQRRRSSSSNRVSQKARILPGGWIQSAKSNRPLRKHKRAVEISRDAVYTISHRGPAAFNVDNAYLLSGDAPPVKQHAFHTPQVDRPHIVIKLTKSSRIRYVGIVNRKGTSDLQSRAKGLTLWVSSDTKNWKQLWQAESPRAEWMVDAGDNTNGQYIKIGLPRRGTLHLNQVTVFGQTELP